MPRTSITYFNEYIMPVNIKSDILTMPIADLPFSEVFKQWAFEHKWADLTQLLTVHAGELQRKKGFSMHLYVELSNFLQKNQLLHLLVLMLFPDPQMFWRFLLDIELIKVSGKEFDRAII